MSKDKEITFKLTAQGAELAINALDKVGGTRHLVNYLEAQYTEQMQPVEHLSGNFEQIKELKKK
jgi:hypothetical protein